MSAEQTDSGGTVHVKSFRGCFNCKTTDTRQWRRTGPDGPRTLCNPCGLYFAKHRTLPDAQQVMKARQPKQARQAKRSLMKQGETETYDDTNHER